MLKKLEWKAILAGVATDLGSTLFIACIHMGMITYKNLDDIKAGDFAFLESYNTPVEHAFWCFIGSICSLLGGMVTARVARQSPYINSISAAFVILFIGSFFISGNAPIFLILLPYIITIPIFLFGVWLTQKFAKPHPHST